jgi:hypothetical protein
MYICDILIVTKIVLGYILGDFFTNSSGHPVCQPCCCVGQFKLVVSLRREVVLLNVEVDQSVLIMLSAVVLVEDLAQWVLPGVDFMN